MPLWLPSYRCAKNDSLQLNDLDKSSTPVDPKVSKGIATVGANGDANGLQHGPVLLFLPTVTRLVLTPRQAPATHLS